MATKTINLTGAEVAVTGLDGAHAHIRNDGTEVIYAAKTAGITTGADGVLSIPAGQAATVYGISGTVYMLGTGSAQIISNDYSELPFKTSATSGGSGADEVARAAISTHAGNAEIHVTADEKAKWNEVNFSNPNLLINPDFRINQRGQTVYDKKGHILDCWYLTLQSTLTTTGTVTIVDDGVKLQSSGSAHDIFLRQIMEHGSDLIGKMVTISFEISDLTGSITVRQHQQTNVSKFTQNGIHSFTFEWKEESAYAVEFYSDDADFSCILKWAKLELGGIATPFTPPDTATELAKCQRYYQIRTTNDIDPIDLCPSMATIKDIKQRSDGNYEYIAEL